MLSKEKALMAVKKIGLILSGGNADPSLIERTLFHTDDGAV